MPDDDDKDLPRFDRNTLNARREAKDPFYETPSWGLNRPGGADSNQQAQEVVAKTRRIVTYTTYQRSMDLAPVGAGKALLQLLPRIISSGGIVRATALGILNITLSIRSAVQAEFAIAECSARGTPTSPLTTFLGQVASQAEGGWQPPQGGSQIIAGYGNAPAANVLGWSVDPTFPTIAAQGGSADGIQLEQAVAPGTVGSAIQWLYSVDDPLVVRNLVNDGAITPAGIVVWNQSTTASPAIRATVRWMEFQASDAPSSFF